MAPRASTASDRRSASIQRKRVMSRFCLGLISLLAAGVFTGSLLAGTGAPYDCDSKRVTILFLPAGHGAFGGFEASTVPGAIVFNGFAPSLGTQAAGLEVNPLTSGIGYGALCAPKRSLPTLTSLANTRVSAPSRLRCSFPRSPLIQITSLPNDNKRLRLVLPPNKLVVSATVKRTGSTLRFAENYCTRSAA